MSHPVTSSTSAPTFRPGAAAQEPRTPHPALQTASTLGPASQTGQNASGTGCLSRIAACLRTFWNAILACFSGRTRQTEHPPFTLAAKLEEGNRMLDEHLAASPGQEPDNRVAVFVMKYNGSHITCFRKVNEGPINISTFAKGELRGFLSRFEACDDTLDIQTFFFKRSPNRHLVGYSQEGSSVYFSRALGRSWRLQEIHQHYYGVTLQEFTSLLDAEVPSQEDRRRITEVM